ncbi:hypothetical protein [Bacillus infantis]|uniref:hypothetical protein n=1 Tax=Bacillus infantis TaxID=324767 RepID=UPI003CE7672E
MEHKFIIKLNKFGYQVFMEWAARRALLSPVLKSKAEVEEFVEMIRKAEVKHRMSESMQKKMEAN